MSESESLLSKIRNSCLCESNSVIKELDNGAVIRIGSGVAKARKEQLYKTYEIRLKFISDRKGLHAQRISNSISEFVENLILEDPEYLQTARVKVNPYGSYLVWFIPNTFKIIGCMFTISQSEVSDGKLEDLWDGKIT
ncbi:hypothetical protein [Agarivorans sp. Toyoura001]|uniref:hypothetical protein n=1 Tax=Agarivorans sp. Toyoura001 TaxID=2283141 RepID=UPI0010F970D4|nr:hypothetical protein [Agarivorans sp. Toyoura001]